MGGVTFHESPRVRILTQILSLDPYRPVNPTRGAMHRIPLILVLNKAERTVQI